MNETTAGGGRAGEDGRRAPAPGRPGSGGPAPATEHEVPHRD